MDISYSNRLLIISLQRGEDFLLRLGTPTQPNTDESGAAVDYSGCTFLCQIRDSADTLIATATTSVLGLGQLRLMPIKTHAWPVGDLWFDLKMTDSGGGESWILRRSLLKVADQVSEAP